MEITVSAISLRNFKGIKHLDVEFGKDTSIFGQNATGKTTILDAFLWCLFGKDSANKADFDIKGLDEKGSVTHNLEHSVDVSLLVDGKTIILTRTYAEKWTKKRGTASTEMTGHTTDYLFNGVPCKEKEYQERIKSIIDENVFRLLTDPRRFNEQTSWQDRRKVLMEICGQVDNAEVIASNKKLSGLTALLNGNSIDDLKKIIASKKKEINDQLEKIPVRIDEATRSMVDVRPDIEAVPDQIKALEDEKAGLESQLSDLRNGGTISKKRIEVAEIDAKIQNQKTAHDIDKSNRIKTRQKELEALEIDARAIRSTKADLEAELSMKQTAADLIEKEIVTLRAAWAAVDEQTFNDPTTCPTCGRDLPDTAINEAQEKFNASKATKLAGINEKGKELKTLQATTIELIAEIKGKIRGLAVSDTERTDLLNKEIASINAEQPDLSNLEGIRASIQAEISNIHVSETESIQNVKMAIDGLSTDINALNADLQKVQANEAAKKRIAELEAQQKDLAKQYEEVEANLFLVENFIRTKVAFLEKRINDKFSLARFNLFSDQINGGLSEVCETTLKGVPYPSINNAGKIQVGMDIIKTLQAHYGITAPVWIDNRESIVELPEMDCQTISLIVSEPDKKLRVAA